MKVIGEDKLGGRNASDIKARKALAAWLKISKEAQWQHLMEVRQTIPDVSGNARGNTTVFNICGGRFRLITIIDYETQTILIKEFFTHKEYDRWNQR